MNICSGSVVLIEPSGICTGSVEPMVGSLERDAKQTKMRRLYAALVLDKAKQQVQPMAKQHKSLDLYILVKWEDYTYKHCAVHAIGARP